MNATHAMLSQPVGKKKKDMLSLAMQKKNARTHAERQC